MPRLKSTICHGADLTTGHTAIVGSVVVIVLVRADAASRPRTDPLRSAAVLPSLTEVVFWGPTRRKSTRGRRAAIRASARAHRDATAATGTPIASLCALA